MQRRMVLDVVAVMLLLMLVMIPQGRLASLTGNAVKLEMLTHLVKRVRDVPEKGQMQRRLVLDVVAVMLLLMIVMIPQGRLASLTGNAVKLEMLTHPVKRVRDVPK